jgi:AraC-like DNA-binding protein/ligand-binding sensor protein
MLKCAALLDSLIHSELVRDFERAFSGATGLPLALRPADAWQPAFRDNRKGNAFCAMMAAKSASCAACLRMQERLSEAAVNGPAMAKCHFGLTEVAVPVKLGESVLGTLVTGQVFTQKPGAAEFERAMKALRRMGIKLDRAEARKAFLATRVVPRSQLQSIMRLLEICADHLSTKAGQLAVRIENVEPMAVIRAKEFIRQNFQEDISLADVARAVCTSRFTICKLFRRHAGVTFTEFVSQFRVERAKELLANPNLRISEIAFTVGFQSITHFNRSFRALAGQAPTAYRESVAIALAA